MCILKNFKKCEKPHILGIFEHLGPKWSILEDFGQKWKLFEFCWKKQKIHFFTLPKTSMQKNQGKSIVLLSRKAIIQPRKRDREIRIKSKK